MKFLVVIAGLLLSLSAFAEPEVGEQAWLTENTSSMRFIDAEVAGPEFVSGKAVTVLFVEGERARVKGEKGFGWVALTSLTSEKPATPDLDMDAMLKKLQNMNLDGGAGSAGFTVGSGMGQ